MSHLLQLTGAVIDMVYAVRALPRSGFEADVTDFMMTPGGGFNAPVAARAAGMQTSMGGSLGTGPLSDMVAAALDAKGITLARPRLSDRDQGCCTVMVEPDGERTFLASPGAEGHITTAALDQIDLAPITHVTLSGYTLIYPHAVDALVEWVPRLPRHCLFLFDPSPIVDRIPDAVLAPILLRADWISANTAEATALTGLSEPMAAARDLAQGRQGAVLRRGAHGCLLAIGDHAQEIPPHPVTAIDTNGAGDCHVGSFLAELARTGDPGAAARYANIAAALSTTRPGPATPPDPDDVRLLTL